MITRLILENWRSHENTEFEFGLGTNVIVGAMGSGKSSAMDAISFALFGTFPNLQSRKVKLDDMIMNKPERKAGAKVSLSFKADGKEYTVKRELTRGKGQTSAEIRVGGSLIEAANKRVNERLEDILRINYDLFSRAVYAEQNSIDYFLEIPKGDRKKKIDELLKIDRFESARKNLTLVIGRINSLASDKANVLSSYKESGETGGLEKGLADDAKVLERKEAGLLEKKKEKEKAEIVYNELLKKKKAFSDQDRKIREEMGRARTFEEKLKEYGMIDKSESELKTAITKKAEERKHAKNLVELKAKREAEREKYEELLKSYNNSLAGFDKKLAELRYDKNAPARLKECKQEVDKVRKTLEETITDYKTIDARLIEVEDSVAKLKEGREKCPTCDAELNEQTVRKLIEQRTEERRKLSAGRTELEKKVGEFDAVRKKLEEEIEGLVKAVNSLEDAEWVNTEKAKTQKLASAANSNLEVIRKMLDGLKIGRTEDEIEKEIRGLEKQLEYFDYKNELEKTMKVIGGLQKELSRLGYNEGEEKKTYDGFKKIETDVTVLANDCKNLSDLISERKKRLDDLKKIKEKMEKTKREIENLKKQVDSFEILQNALQTVQGKLREEFIEETNVALVDVWKRLYPYADYTSLKLAVDETGDYILRLQRRDGGWTNVEGTTSGGERSTACLALRIALSLVLAQNLSWLVLDEPTHNLDRRAIRELAITLREHLPKIVDQVFVITHEEELESAASGYLYRLQRNKEEDEPTKIVTEQSSA